MARPRLSASDESSARNRLVRVARDLYLSSGLEGVSLRKLAERAQLSHTYVYRYFASKAELMVALRIECSRRFVDYVVATDEPSATPAERITLMASAIAQFAVENEAEYRLLFTLDQPSPQTFPELLAIRQQLAEHVASVVALLLNDLRAEGDSMVIAQMMWAGVHGIASLHLAGQLVHGCEMDDLLAPMLKRFTQTGRAI